MVQQIENLVRIFGERGLMSAAMRLRQLGQDLDNEGLIPKNLGQLIYTEDSSRGRMYEHQNFLFFPEIRTIVVKGKERKLTSRENGLLQAFVEKPNIVQSLDELKLRVWGNKAYSRSNITHWIASLRKKIEPIPDSPEIIIWKRNFGYYLRDELRMVPENPKPRVAK